MRPLSIHARNYRTWGELDLELPSGCVAILGENGAGKSSILQVIELALFGPRSRTLADYLTADSGETELELTLVFEHRGQLYRVRRAYSARGRGQSKVDLERYSGDSAATDTDMDEAWHALTRETARETQSAIEDLLGLTRDTFRASAFLAQGDGAAFTECDPRERKRILTEILDLRVWERLLELVRADKTSIEKDLDRLAGRLEAAEAELAGKAAAIAERDSAAAERQTAVVGVTGAEKVLADAERLLASARETAAARDAADQLLAERSRALAETERRVDRLNDEHMGLQEDLGEKPALEREASRLPVLEAAAQSAGELVRADREIDDTSRVYEELDRRLLDATRSLSSITDVDEAHCPMCGQTLHDEAQEKAEASARARCDELTIQLAETRARIDEARERRKTALGMMGDLEGIDVDRLLTVARAAKERLAGMAERERRLHAIGEESEREVLLLVEQEQAVTAARAQLEEFADAPEMDALAQRAEEARTVVNARRERVAELDRQIARCDERLQRLAEIEAATVYDREQRDGLRRGLDTLLVLERAFGRDGIPALILENAAIPQIEIEANRILQDLGKPFTVELHTQRALKSGDGLREALDIIVSAHGVSRPYETFSGGERARINIALRIALARLLAHRRGAEISFLAIDEISDLDPEGMERLGQELRVLAADFDPILLVSHHPVLQDSFDQVITVVKEDERSAIVANQAPAEAAVA